MKKIIKDFRIYALVIISVISSAACGNGKDILDGTVWTARIESFGYSPKDFILTFNSQNYTMYRDGEKSNGTYSISGDNVTLTPEYVSDPMVGTISKSKNSLYFDADGNNLGFNLALPYSSEEFGTQYPIGLISYAGYPYELTVQELLDQNNLANTSSIESVFISGYNKLTMILTHSANEESLCWIVSFENDIARETCNIMSICIYSSVEGEMVKIEYDETAQTLGILVGAFVRMVKIFYNYGQTINDTWHNEENGTDEDFGEYTITETLTIQGDTYTLITEMTSEYSPFRGWGERGSVDMAEPDVSFMLKDETNNIFSDDEWEATTVSQVNKFRYEISDGFLIHTKNKVRKV
jgi:hypothetical protein